MSPARNWPDPAAEAASIQRARQSWDRILAARRTVTAADATAVSTMSANYPHMSPGTVVPLAQQGIAPDDPLAQYTATQEAKSNKKKRGFWGAVGDWANPVHLIGNIGEAVVGDVLNPIGGAALGAAKQVLRPGLAALAAPFEVGTGVVRNIAAAGGNIGAGIATGAAVGAAGGLFAGGIGAIPGALGGAVVGGITAGAALGAGAGALADMRGVKIESEGFVNPLSQSALFQSFGEKGLGSGYMPGGTAHEAAADAARRSAAISGHALTPGRFLASSVVEEGTAPYNLLSGALDAATAWELDPTALAGKGVNAWRKSAKTFTATEREIAAAGRLSKIERADTGLVEGSRKTIIGEKVESWLGTAKGQKSMQWFADHGFEQIRQQMGKNVDISTIRDLADATTIEEVSGILRPKLGIARGMEMKPTVGGFGMEVKRVAAKMPMYDKVKESRMWSDLPGGRVDYSKPTEATEEFNLLLRDANRHLDADFDIDGVTEQFGRLMLENTYESRRAADALAYRAFGGSKGKVAQSEVGRQFMNKLAKRAADGDDKVLRDLIDEDVLNMPSTRASVNGQTVNMPSSGFLADHFDRGFDIDRSTIRGIRAATSKYSRLINNPKIQLGVSATSGLTDNVWKPAALLRGAWTVRVVGEEQIRMAAAGRLSLFNHPLSYLAWAMDDEGRIAKIFKKHGIEVGGRGGVDVKGEEFYREGSTIEAANTEFERDLLDGADEAATAANFRQQSQAWQGRDFTAAGHTFNYTRGMPGHVEGTAENIDRAFGDPVMQMLAAEPRHVVREWLINGDGKVYRDAMNKQGARLRTNADIDRHLDNAAKQIDSIMGRTAETGALSPAALVDPTAARGPVQHAAARPGSPAIRDAIARGELNGVPIRKPNGQPNPEFISELRKIETELPESITASAAHMPNKRWADKRDRAVQTMFTNFMTRPSAKLSRSPMFRQTYWAEAENLITELDPAAQARLIDNARVAKLDSGAIRRLEARKAASSGELTLDEADLVLKGRGLDRTQDLLYDAAKRGQISDVMRIIMPFAEAQKEVMTTWAKLGLVDNVAVARRAAQSLDAARGSGHFYKDPGTGEEMFTFPGSQFLTEKTLGLPIPLTGRVAGLNTFGSGIIPGLGPAVQIPTRYLLPDKPQFDSIRKFLDPFGANAAEAEGLLESQFPGWLTALKRGLDADDSDRTFANAVKDTWAQGVSAGRYSTATPDDIREGLDHAKSTARWLYIIKAGAQLGGAPTPPSPAFMAMDKDGRWHMAKALSEDYRKMIEDPEIGFDGANAAFVDKYGNNAAAFMQSKTFSTIPTAPSTGDFRQWTRGADAQNLQEKYGDVYALFGPQGEGFDYTQYLRNINSGATETLTPQQFAEQTNDRQGKMIYYNFKDRFGPTPSKEQREWLSGLRAQLREKLPGFDIPVPGKPDVAVIKNQFIPQIEKAVTDPSLADNEVARATRAYLQARALAKQAAEAAGYKSFDQAKNAAPLRDWLRQVLDQLSQKVPDFTSMAERVFDREMIEDDTPEAVPA